MRKSTEVLLNLFGAVLNATMIVPDVVFQRYGWLCLQMFFIGWSFFRVNTIIKDLDGDNTLSQPEEDR